jgi:hypothetical protein
MPRWLALLVPLLTTAASRGAVVYAGGSWAAIDRGSQCEALSRSVKIAADGKVQPIAGFTFTADRRHWGEFHARLSRMPRANASVMLKVGDQPFLLVARGNDAWSSGPLQDQAIIAAMREGGWITVESRDAAGGRFADPYSSDGAATAIDAAAARCADKMQPH